MTPGELARLRPILARVPSPYFRRVLALVTSLATPDRVRVAERAPNQDGDDPPAVPPWTTADLAWAARDGGYPDSPELQTLRRALVEVDVEAAEHDG